MDPKLTLSIIILCQTTNHKKFGTPSKEEKQHRPFGSKPGIWLFENYLTIVVTNWKLSEDQSKIEFIENSSKQITLVLNFEIWLIEIRRTIEISN